MTDNLVGSITVHPHKPIMKAYAARRLAAKDRDGLADPEDIAIELGIGLYEVTELVRRYQDSFDWASPRLECADACRKFARLSAGGVR